MTLFAICDTPLPNMANYDVILVNSSAGKDSQTCLRQVVAAATAAGVLHRVVVVHADLGRVEWKGTKALAREQALHYGLPFIACRRTKGDLLEEMEHQRQKWPDKNNRWCTSDQKTAQVAKVMTALVREHRAGQTGPPRQVRILNCLGIRAQESRERAREVPFRFDRRVSNGRRHVDRWYPIHDWSLERVWEDIRASGVRHHPAYDLGMPRLSCVFCVFSSRSALTLAAQHNPELADEYVRVELTTGHRFKNDLSMAEVVADAKALPPVTTVENWTA